MIKKLRSFIIWAAAAVMCISALSISSFAATAVDISLINGYKPGPGDHSDASGNIVSLSGETLVDSKGNIIKSNTVNDTKEEAAEEKAISSSANYTYEVKDGVGIYTFEGKKYKAGASYGVHKLTGYSAEEFGTSMTASGKNARAKHTIAAASNLPMGTVLILKGTAGPYSSDYDGLYAVEDRGGSKLENEGWLDIYFDTAKEAAHTTDAGWNYAEAWIAEPAE